MARVQFGRGTNAIYTACPEDRKKDMVFFNTDTQEIVINGTAFGFSKADSENLAAIKAEVDAFFKKDATIEGAIDTLKEIVNYIENNGGQAGDLIKLINDAQDAADQAQEEVDALEEIVGTGFTKENTVSIQLAAVKATADSAVQEVKDGETNGTIIVDGVDVKVAGLKSAAYEDKGAFDAAGTAQGLIDALAGGDNDGNIVKVSVTSLKGEVTEVTVDDSLAATAQSVIDEVNRASGQEDKIEAAIGLNEDGTHKTSNGEYSKSATTIAEEISLVEAQVVLNETSINTIDGAATVEGSFRKGDADTLSSAKTYAENLLDWYEGN